MRNLGDLLVGQPQAAPRFDWDRANRVRNRVCHGRGIGRTTCACEESITVMENGETAVFFVPNMRYARFVTDRMFETLRLLGKDKRSYKRLGMGLVHQKSGGSLRCISVSSGIQRGIVILPDDAVIIDDLGECEEQVGRASWYEFMQCVG